MTGNAHNYEIFIFGCGAFGTSFAQCLAKNNHQVSLICRSDSTIEEINNYHTNKKYLPRSILPPNIKAFTEVNMHSSYAIIFFAVPSNAILHLLKDVSCKIGRNTIIVNLAKGLHTDGNTLTSMMSNLINSPVCTLKGPTFSNELTTNQPSAFTLGYKKDIHKIIISSLFINTNITLDFTKDITGVEYLGALKNIYAIILGIVDAYSDSANMRFMILTKAVNETRCALRQLGAKPDTIMKFCGIGDLGLTALNDQSRNRTLGLLIGKGFFTFSTQNNIILEGLNSLSILKNILSDSHKFPLLTSLYDLIYNKITLHEFYAKIS